MGMAIATWGPFDPTVAGALKVYTLRPGEVILAAFAWVQAPTSNGSSGVLSASGDSSAMFSLNLTPEGATYGPGLIQGVSVLAGGNTARICQGGETLSLVWTPGGGPGTAQPIFRVAVLTEQIF